jgi:Tfp pilus assembly protein PilF
MNSGAAYLQVGRLYLRKQDFPAAAAALEKAVALSPGLAEAHARLGTAYQYIHKSPEALAEYKKAVDLDPANTDYRTTYGLILGIANQDEAGAAELRKVIETPGYKSADAYINLGWIYRNMEPKKADQSVAAYKKALEIDSKSEQAALGLGWSYTYLKNWDEAIKAFQQAMEIDPTTASEAENGIAWSYFFKKDMPQAKAHLEKAKTAGRGDTRLATNIERAEKGLSAEGGPEMPKGPPPAPKIERPDAGTLCDALARGGAGQKIRTANQLVSYGAEGVPCLIAALTDDSWDVRTAAANALGAIGPRASAGLPHLTSILNSARVTEKTVMTKEEMQLMLKEEDFRKAVRNAVLRIQGK